MSETERRYRYAHNRVLIEAQRILNPQFDDAVVFLSGAQIELLRNASQYLNRLTTYVAQYNPGYYLTPTVEDFDSILQIVADLEETLMGNPNTIWGYADRWDEAQEEESVGDSYTFVSTDPVPAGYVYVLEHWTLLHLGGTTCGLVFGIGVNAALPLIWKAPAVPSAEYVPARTRMTLKAGDYLTLGAVGLPSGETVHLDVWGYKMKVPE